MGRFVAHETIGTSVGIVGFGAVGRALAGLLKGFNSRLLVYDPYASPEALADVNAVVTELDELFAQADVVGTHVPSTPGTHPTRS